MRTFGPDKYTNKYTHSHGFPSFMGSFHRRNIYNNTVRVLDCLVCVFVPHVLRDPVSVSRSLCYLVQVCRVISP